MATLLTLVRPDLPPPVPALPAGYRLRPCSADDVEPLGHRYFDSYDPGEACATVDEAVADIRAAFAGEYGELWPAASLVATAGEGDVVAAVQVVRRAPWPDTPDCPFVIELFTAPAHRRRGLARALIAGSLAVVADAGRPALALRVSATNRAALGLYRDLGFRDWRP
jgi:N-alpha-acetyltransferase 10/11